MTLDKRAFLLGFILGKLSAEDTPYGKWHTDIFILCSKFGMSPPERPEMKELGEYMTFVNELMHNKIRKIDP
jgi:hypothetical protein